MDSGLSSRYLWSQKALDHYYPIEFPFLILIIFIESHVCLFVCFLNPPHYIWGKNDCLQQNTIQMSPTND